MARKSRSAAAWGREEPSRTLPRRSAWPAVQIGNAVYWRRSEFELLEHVTVPINKVCSSMCSGVTSCVMCNEHVPVEQGALADATRCSFQPGARRRVRRRAVAAALRAGRAGGGGGGVAPPPSRAAARRSVHAFGLPLHRASTQISAHLGSSRGISRSLGCTFTEPWTQIAQAHAPPSPRRAS